MLLWKKIDQVTDKLNFQLLFGLIYVTKAKYNDDFNERIVIHSPKDKFEREKKHSSSNDDDKDE